MSSRTGCAQNISINKNCRNQLNSLSLLILCHRGGGVDERKQLQREAEELNALVEQAQRGTDQQREEAEARAKQAEAELMVLLDAESASSESKAEQARARWYG